MIRQLTTQHAELRTSQFNVATRLPRLWHLCFWSLLASRETATIGQGCNAIETIQESESESELAGPKAAPLGRKQKQFKNLPIIYYAR